jgi:hypothetical protein
MGTWKQIVFFGIVATFAFGFAFVGCDNDNEKTVHEHQWENWIQTIAPTTLAEGEETKECSTCGEKETRPVAKIEEFTVMFNANGGSPTPQNQSVTKGGKITEPQGVAKNTKTLVGWYREGTFSNKWDFVNGTVSADITLFAKWDCECPIGTTHEPNEKCCEGADCKCAIAEPSNENRNFPNITLFGTYKATIQDERTSCGSATLQEKGTIAIIQKAFKDAYDNAEIYEQWDMENILGGGITIIVNNPPDVYKVKATTRYKMYFHFDYLHSNPTDILQNIVDVVSAMIFDQELPFEK